MMSLLQQLTNNVHHHSHTMYSIINTPPHIAHMHSHSMHIKYTLLTTIARDIFFESHRHSCYTMFLRMSSLIQVCKTSLTSLPATPKCPTPNYREAANSSCLPLVRASVPPRGGADTNVHSAPAQEMRVAGRSDIHTDAMSRDMYSENSTIANEKKCELLS